MDRVAFTLDGELYCVDCAAYVGAVAPARRRRTAGHIHRCVRCGAHVAVLADRSRPSWAEGGWRARAGLSEVPGSM